jgi:hypothetical protein
MIEKRQADRAYREGRLVMDSKQDLVNEINRLQRGINMIAEMDDEENEWDGRDRFRRVRDFARRVRDGIVPYAVEQADNPTPNLMCSSCGSGVTEREILWRCDCTRMQWIAPMPSRDEQSPPQEQKR